MKKVMKNLIKIHGQNYHFNIINDREQVVSLPYNGGKGKGRYIHFEYWKGEKPKNPPRKRYFHLDFTESLINK